MAFLNEMAAKLTETGQKTKKMANDLVDTAKLGTQCSEVGKEIQESYTRLGEVYFRLRGATPEAGELAEICAHIVAKQEQLSTLRIELQRLKNIKVCPQCGKENPPDTAYCGHCSTQLPTLPPRQTAADSHFCPSCGATIVGGAHFCIKCGTKME